MFKSQYAPNLKQGFFPGNKLDEKELVSLSNLIIDCDSIGKVLWDLTILLITISLSFMIPFSLSFYSDYDPKIWSAIFLMFCLDVIISFNTSFYFNGIKVAQRKYIALYYLKTWFVFDLLGTFPYEHFFFNEFNYDVDYPVNDSNDLNNYIRYLMLFKLLRLLKFNNVIFLVQEIFPIKLIHSITSFLTYFVALALPVHLMVCGFNRLYCNNLDQSHEHLHNLRYDNKARYYSFLLRSVETMIGVGFGEFPVKSQSEKVFSIIAMTITSCFIGYIVGQIQTTVEKSNKINYYFRNINQKTTKYCKISSIPSALQSKIKAFLRNLKYLYQKRLIMEEDILNLLSSNLRNQIFSQVRGGFLLKSKIFQEFSNQCLRATGSYLKLQMFSPEDIILWESQLSNDMHFIITGQIQIFHYSTKTVFKILSKKDYFGEFGFFFDIPRTASAKSTTFSEVLTLKKIDFLKILKTLPKDKAKLDVIQRNFKSYSFASLNVSCYLCRSVEHISRDCDQFVIPKNFDYSKLKKRKIRPLGKANDLDPKPFLKRMCVNNTRGLMRSPTRLFSNNFFLAKKAEDFNHWRSGTSSRNSQILTLLNKIEKEDNSEDLEDDSESSRENYFNFEFSRSHKLKSIMLQKKEHSEQTPRLSSF